jgi:hypothetical protein
MRVLLVVELQDVFKECVTKKVLRFKSTCALFVETRSWCQILASPACLHTVSSCLIINHFNPSTRVREAL